MTVSNGSFGHNIAFNRWWRRCTPADAALRTPADATLRTPPSLLLHAGGRQQTPFRSLGTTLAMPRAIDVGGAPVVKLSKRLQGTEGGCGAFDFKLVLTSYLRRMASTLRGRRVRSPGWGLHQVGPRNSPKGKADFRWRCLLSCGTEQYLIIKMISGKDVVRCH